MASKRIKGIVIEIEGKTSGLVSELKKADAALRTTQSALRDVNKALKLDPTNADLIASKQKLLNSAIEETKAKLKAEKQAAEDAKKQLELGNITEEEYAKLQADIVKTTDKLQKLEEEQKKLGTVSQEQMKAYGEKFQQVGEKISNAGESLTRGLTLPIVAMGAASVKAFQEVDNGMDIIAAKTGATGDALSSMEDIAKGLATTIPTSFEEAGNAVGEVNTRFGVTGDELQTLSGQFIKFAQLNNTDVSNSIDNVQKTLSAFGLSSKDAGAMLDTLNKVGQDTGISVDKLSQAMVTNGSTLKEMGFNAAQSAVFLGNLEKSGVDSSQAMTGLKAALKNATQDGKSMQDALGELQTRIKGASSSTEAMSIAMELFGNKAGASLGSAIYDGTLNLEAMSDELVTLDSNLGNVDSTFDTTLDGVDSMTTAMNAAKEALAEVGEAIGTALAPMLKAAAEKAKDFAKWFGNLDDGTKELIVTIAGIVAAIGPLLIIIGKVSTGIGALITIGAKIGPLVTTIVSGVKNVIATVTALPTVMSLAGTAGTGMFASLTAAFESFSAAIMANPIGLLIAAIVALVAAIGYAIYAIATEEEAIKSVDQAQADLAEAHNKTVDVMNSYVGAADSVAEATEALKKAEEEAGQSGEELFNQFNNGTLTYENMTAAQQKALKAYIDLNAKQKELEAQSQALAEAKNAETVASYENQLAMIAENGSVEDNMQAYEDYKKSVIDAFEKGTISADQARDLIGASMSEMSADAQITFVEDIPGDINEGFNPYNYQTTLQAYSNTFSGLWNWTKEGWSAVTEWLSGVWSSFSDFFSGLGENIKNVWNGVTSWISGVWDGAVSTITGAWDSVSDAVSGVVDKVFDTLGGFWDKAKTWGSDLINGFVDGIKSAWDTLTNTVESVAKSVADFLHFSVPEKGPLADFDESGADMVDVFIEGIDKNLDKVRDTMLNMAGVVAGTPLDVNMSAQSSASRSSGLIQPITINQTINANETSYVEQQKAAAYEFKQIARMI